MLGVSLIFVEMSYLFWTVKSKNTIHEDLETIRASGGKLVSQEEALKLLRPKLLAEGKLYVKTDRTLAREATHSVWVYHGLPVFFVQVYRYFEYRYTGT